MRRIFLACNERPGFRLAQFSVQSNHIHLVVEADDHLALTRGMRGLCTRMARAINRLLGRRGPVFADRYHARMLKTPREVRLALQYVLSNARRHGLRLPAHGLDVCSSAPWFDGWIEGPPDRPSREPPPVAPPRTWLLAQGWRRHGLLAPDVRPGRP